MNILLLQLWALHRQRLRIYSLCCQLLLLSQHLLEKCLPIMSVCGCLWHQHLWLTRGAVFWLGCEKNEIVTCCTVDVAHCVSRLQMCDALQPGLIEQGGLYPPNHTVQNVAVTRVKHLESFVDL